MNQHFFGLLKITGCIEYERRVRINWYYRSSQINAPVDFYCDSSFSRQAMFRAVAFCNKYDTRSACTRGAGNRRRRYCISRMRNE